MKKEENLELNYGIGTLLTNAYFCLDRCKPFDKSYDSFTSEEKRAYERMRVILDGMSACIIGLVANFPNVDDSLENFIAFGVDTISDTMRGPEADLQEFESYVIEFCNMYSRGKEIMAKQARDMIEAHKVANHPTLNLVPPLQ